MKYQSQFSEKNINLLSTEFAHRVVKVKDRHIDNTWCCYQLVPRVYAWVEKEKELSQTFTT